jgi:hypothetical protein
MHFRFRFGFGLNVDDDGDAVHGEVEAVLGFGFFGSVAGLYEQLRISER